MARRNEYRSDYALAMETPRLRDHLPCTQCGFDLMGLDLVGRCPECGKGVISTITRSEVPYALRLRALVRPKQSAIGLACIGAGLVVATASLSAPLATRALFELSGSRPIEPIWTEPLSNALLVVGSIIAFIGSCIVVPQSDTLLREEVQSRHFLSWWQRLWVLRLALAGWMFVAAVKFVGPFLDWPKAVGLQPNGWILLNTGALLLLGALAERSLSRLFSVLGHRSRLFIEGAHARQSIDVLVVAGAASLIGRAATLLIRRMGDSEWIVLPTAISLVGGVLLILAMFYLASNAIWIVRALWISRPPTLLSAE